jgi:hypothetical protein
MVRRLSLSKLYPWHFHPQSAAWGIKEYPGIFVQRFQLHHHERVEHPWNAFADCSEMALRHPMWQKARGEMSVRDFGKQQGWVFDALDPLEHQWFASRRETLQALQMALIVWESSQEASGSHLLRS